MLLCGTVPPIHVNAATRAAPTKRRLFTNCSHQLDNVARGIAHVERKARPEWLLVHALFDDCNLKCFLNHRIRMPAVFERELRRGNARRDDLESWQYITREIV